MGAVSALSIINLQCQLCDEWNKVRHRKLFFSPRHDRAGTHIQYLSCDAARQVARYIGDRSRCFLHLQWTPKCNLGYVSREDVYSEDSSGVFPPFTAPEKGN